MTMTYLISVGATVRILAGAWCFTADKIGLIIFASSLNRATYFAAGDGVKGVKLGICSNLSGIIRGLVCRIFLDALLCEVVVTDKAGKIINANHDHSKAKGSPLEKIFHSFYRRVRGLWDRNPSIKRYCADKGYRGTFIYDAYGLLHCRVDISANIKHSLH